MADCLEEMQCNGIPPTEYDWKNYILAHERVPGDAALEESWRAMEAAEALEDPPSCHLYCAVLLVCQISNRPDIGKVGAASLFYVFLVFLGGEGSNFYFFVLHDAFCSCDVPMCLDDIRGY